MKRLIVMAVLLVLCVSVRVEAAGEAGEPVTAEAVRGFEQILDLWRDGRTDEVYHRTLRQGRKTRESFSAQLSATQRRPACCWEKLRDTHATAVDDHRVDLRATVGIDSPTGMESNTRTFQLVKDEGVWKVPLGDILALAGAKKATYRHTRKKKARQ